MCLLSEWDVMKINSLLQMNYLFIFSTSKEEPFKPLYALIITPTRELAIQIQVHLTALVKYTDIKVGNMYFIKLCFGHHIINIFFTL